MTAAALPTVGQLAAAACAGRSPMFDLDIHGETELERRARHRHALALCARCPVLAACAALRGRRGDGVWAGKLHSPRTSPTPGACVQCDGEFEPRRSDALFCTAACRTRARRAREAAAADGRPPLVKIT